MKQNKTQNVLTTAFGKAKLSASVLMLMGASLLMNPAQAVELIHLMVAESGMQRVTYDDLAQQGADLTGVRNSNLNITVDGNPVPILVHGRTDTKGRGTSQFFGPGAYIDFYAESADSLYTNERAFTLHFVTRQERRDLPRINIMADRTKVDATSDVSTVYLHTAVFEENNYYDFSSPTATDPWHYGQNYSIFSTPTHTFELTDVVGGTATASLRSEVLGMVDFDIEGNDHHYEVLVNDVNLGDQRFDGNAVDVFTSDEAVVSDGSNTFKFNFRPIAGVPFDILALNKFEVSYLRHTVAEASYLEGEFNTSGHARVSGITQQDAVVYRVNSPGNIQILESVVNGGQVLFNTSGVSGKYIVVGADDESDGFRSPRPQKLLAIEDISDGDAEYLIIAHSSLEGDALNELVQLRSAEYSVKLVDAEQIYAQYGAHVPDAAAIQKYIHFAAENLGTRFVVFVGNDTYDYKKYATNSVSLIPTKYQTTPGGLLTVTQTPSDAAYGDLDGDLVPDLPVGRISVRTQDELQSVVNKLKAYQRREGYAGRVLVAADKEDAGNGISFTQDAEALISAMPKAWRDSIRSDFRAYPDVDGGQLAHEKTLAAINAGVSVVNFIGHSSHTRWSFSTPPILLSSQISSLTNVNKPALVTQWGCWNSYYVDPAGNTMADSFLLGGENGAATVLGASTLTTSEGERSLGVELNKRMYNQGITIGEAVIQAKQALAANEDFPAIQLGWQIIGDPALKINP